VSDSARLLPRCPRCGYGLRIVRGYWWCDICRVPLVPQRGPSIREVFRAAFESLREFLAPTPRRRATLVYASIPPVQQGAALARCPSCGSLTPRETPSCIHCGTSFGQPAEPTRVQSIAQSQTPDDLVYRYVVENEGEISLSKASADLRMSLADLQSSIARLQASGRIMRDSQQGNR
jgi:uncharacterized C2H2 Zn-finger protein